MKKKDYMQKFLENVQNNHFEEIDEHLYYYYQGLNIGKEEARLEMALSLANLGIDLDIITQVTQIPLEILTQ